MCQDRQVEMEEKCMNVPTHLFNIGAALRIEGDVYEITGFAAGQIVLEGKPERTHYLNIIGGKAYFRTPEVSVCNPTFEEHRITVGSDFCDEMANTMIEL